MIDRWKTLWAVRSPREQWMLGVMFALLALVILWLGILRPLQSAQRSARDALREATDRNAQIRTNVKLLKSLPPSTPGPNSDAIDYFVREKAAEAGLTLERAQPQGYGRVDIALASVRPVALFSWLALLETQGIQVETINTRPAPTSGSVSVQAVLVRGAAR